MAAAAGGCKGFLDVAGYTWLGSLANERPCGLSVVDTPAASFVAAESFCPSLCAHGCMRTYMCMSILGMFGDGLRCIFYAV